MNASSCCSSRSTSSEVEKDSTFVALRGKTAEEYILSPSSKLRSLSAQLPVDLMQKKAPVLYRQYSGREPKCACSALSIS